MNEYIESALRIFPQFDFYRKNYGGKAAGLKLLEEILRTNPYYFSFEDKYSLLPCKFLSLKLYDYFKKYKNNNPSIYRITLPRNTINSQNKFHFRSSSTLEDWIDLSLFGTFLTISEKIQHKRDLVSSISALFQSFTYYQEISYISENESLGVVIMPSLYNSERYKLINVQVDTFNDGENDVYRIESSQEGSFEDRINLSQLIDYMSNENISIYQLSKEYYELDSKDSFNFNNPYEVNGMRSSISNKEIRNIVRLATLCKKTLGFEVNLEFGILQDRRSSYGGYIFPLQLRPSPNQAVFKKIELDTNYIMLGKTPCVFNEFDMELPLLFREGYKYSDDFGDKDYFSLHRDGRQYNRLRGDEKKFSQIKGVIGIDSGFALNHDMELLPHTFYGRNEFRYLGIPHMGDQIQNFLTAQIGEHSSLISEVPFKMQSNGRYGQISLHKKHFSKLHYGQETLKLKKLNDLIQELKMGEEIPF